MDLRNGDDNGLQGGESANDDGIGEDAYVHNGDDMDEGDEEFPHEGSESDNDSGLNVDTEDMIGAEDSIEEEEEEEEDDDDEEEEEDNDAEDPEDEDANLDEMEEEEPDQNVIIKKGDHLYLNNVFFLSLFRCIQIEYCIKRNTCCNERFAGGRY